MLTFAWISEKFHKSLDASSPRRDVDLCDENTRWNPVLMSVEIQHRFFLDSKECVLYRIKHITAEDFPPYIQIYVYISAVCEASQSETTLKYIICTFFCSIFSFSHFTLAWLTLLLCFDESRAAKWGEKSERERVKRRSWVSREFVHNKYTWSLNKVGGGQDICDFPFCRVSLSLAIAIVVVFSVTSSGKFEEKECTRGICDSVNFR